MTTIQQMDLAVPYEERHYRTKTGTTLVWPFLNLKPTKSGPELFLDNNALNNVQWLADVPDNIRHGCVVNPFMAIQEQWFSNSVFREDPVARIDSWTSYLAPYGIKFRPRYAGEQAALLRKNEKALRRQFSAIVPFVAIMRTLVSQRLSLDDALARLADLGQADIPRFSGAIALTALTVALRKKQSFKLQGETATAYSLLESFLAFQPGKKDETDHMNVAYLRNRAGDLNVWLMLPILRQLGFSIGSHSALATGDKALHRVILRTVPPVMMESGTTSFTLAPKELPPEVEQQVWSVLKQIEFRGQATPDLQRARMRNIFDIAKAWTNDPREQEALEEMFAEWWLPGHGLQILPL